MSHGKRMAQGSRCGQGLGIGSSLTRPSPLCCSRHQPQLLVRTAVLSLCRGMFWGGFSLPLCTHAGLPSWPCASENIARGAQSVLVRACTVPKKLFCRKTLSKTHIQAKWCLPSFLPMFFSIFSPSFVHSSLSRPHPPALSTAACLLWHKGFTKELAFETNTNSSSLSQADKSLCTRRPGVRALIQPCQFWSQCGQHQLVHPSQVTPGPICSHQRAFTPLGQLS